jgi:cytochrome P450
VTLTNLICNIIQHPVIESNLRTSLSLSYPSFSLNCSTLSDLAKELDLDPDPYLSLALNETLRLEPPVPCSTSFCLTETKNISGVEILAGDMLITNIYKLHHLEDWRTNGAQTMTSSGLKDL